jgi:hypothetical protein
VSDNLHSGMDAADVALSKSLQEQSAADRNAGGRIDVMHADADSAPMADSLNAAPRRVDVVQLPAEPSGDYKEPSLQGSKGDVTRDQIVNRMREQRENDRLDAIEEREEILRQAGIEGGPPDAPAEPTGKVRLRVRGQQIDVDPEELLALAQKGSAGDSYLAESRRILDEAKQQAREMVEAAKVQAELDGLRSRQGVSPQDLDEVYNTIAYSDPDEGKEALARVVNEKAAELTQQQAEAREIERSKQAMTAWVQQNEDLARDDIAMGAMQHRLFNYFREDWQRVGFDVRQLQSDDQVVSMHMKMRAGNHGVRPMSEIFDRAKDDFLAWRGGARPAPRANGSAPQRPRQAEPRLEINVDRSARRAQIPTQARSSAPLRVPLTEPMEVNQAERRQNVAQNMIAARRKGRGAV